MSSLAVSDGFNLPATNFYSNLPLLKPRRQGIHNRADQYFTSLHFVPVKDSDSYDFDAIEEDFISEQTLQPNNKSIRSDTKSQKRKRKHKRTLPTEPTANSTSNNRRKGRRDSKNYGSETVQMPPWLSQYEDDNLVGSYYLAEESQSTSFAPSKTSVNGAGNNCDNESNPNEQLSQMQRLQFAMNGIFYHPTTNNINPTTDTARTNSVPEAIPYFTPSEIHEVMDAIRVASHGNSNLMAGCADFLYLMLTLEEEGVLTSDFLTNEPWDNDDIGTSDDRWDNAMGQGRPDPHSIMTRDVLVAAAFHYCDCVRARKAGVYDYARQSMEASLDIRTRKELERKKQLWLPSAVEGRGDDDVDNPRRSEDKGLVNFEGRQDKTISVEEDGESIVVSGTKSETRRGESPIDHYGEESLNIAAGAARLKRAEIMSTIVNSNGGQTSRGNAKKPNNSGDAEILRSFLVSLSEDWRSLVIRSSACLYRLKGIVQELEGAKSTGSVVLSTNTINTARDAFRVYAPLAQRLGMQRLKTELENTAFRIIYPRQFSVASSLYSGDIDEMKSIVLVLSSRIEQLLRSDQVFVDQIEDVTVTSRVKEPYSLWKKLLRYRKENPNAMRETSENTNADGQSVASAPLSLKWVPDTIAFRVVLRALKLSPLEDDESLRTREKMLCYYALQLISDVWPASTRNEAKDYIKNPKPNGYQSLHYTASLVIAGEDWPFEVQIRSEEMHRIAEFGVAAHWDYKLQNKVTKSLPDNTVSHGNTPLLALPPASNSTTTLAEIQPVKANSSTTETAEGSSRFSQKGRVASHIEALTTSRETIVQNYRFIFLSSTESALDGRIVSIDASASNIADVLEKYCSTIGEDTLNDISDGTMEIFQNGVSTSLDGELLNGDVLTLPGIIIDKLSV
ncbi:hypothetical protein ACHAXR_010763 [Thalassiosira sp. AJA248-18]